jgi:hypothetical protein
VLASTNQQSKAVGTISTAVSVRRLCLLTRTPIGRRYVLNKGSHLLGRHARAAGFNLNLHAVCQGHAAPHLHHARLDRPRRHLIGRACLQRPHALQAQARVCPPADQQQLLKMPLLVPGATFGAVGTVHQALCDVEPDGASGHAGQSSQVVNGIARGVGWDSDHEGSFQTLITYSPMILARWSLDVQADDRQHTRNNRMPPLLYVVGA